MRCALGGILFVIFVTAFTSEASANPDLVCPGSVVVEASYDPATGLLPEQSTPAWTLTDDDGSLREVVTSGGEPVLRITDNDLLADPNGACQPQTPGDNGVVYALAAPELGTATVYGMEARVRFAAECTGDNGNFAELQFGVIDGERVAAVDVGASTRPGVAFMGMHGDLVGDPVPVDASQLHTYTIRCERGVRCELFVDGGAAALLSVAWAALPSVSDLSSDTSPLPLPFLAGAFALHNQRATTEWADISVLACAGGSAEVASVAIAASALDISAILPPATGVKITSKLVGAGGATFQLAGAQAFLDAGRTCDAVGKIDAAAGKIAAATTQAAGLPLCPGGASCIPAASQTTTLGLLAIDAVLVNDAVVSTCLQDPSCAACPEGVLAGTCNGDILNDPSAWGEVPIVGACGGSRTDFTATFSSWTRKFEGVCGDDFEGECFGGASVSDPTGADFDVRDYIDLAGTIVVEWAPPAPVPCEPCTWF